jgi:hypothetical protein
MSFAGLVESNDKKKPSSKKIRGISIITPVVAAQVDQLSKAVLDLD